MIPTTQRNKLLERKFAEDVNPKFKVGSNADGLYLEMRKWGTVVKIPINDAFFENAETDYRESVTQKLYVAFADALPSEVKEAEPATPIGYQPAQVGGGVPAPQVAVIKKDKTVEVKPAEDFDMRDGDLTVSGNLSESDAELDHELAPPNLQSMTVSDAKEVIEAIESPEVLLSLGDQERDGKNRKGVLEAIAAALEGFAE